MEPEPGKMRAVKSRRYIQDLIEEGEHDRQDFKFQISDARKIARSMSAFANNGGGRLLVGVKDNGRIAGVRSDEEIYMIELAATTYCDPPQQVECKVYSVEGKTVLKVDIPRCDHPPVRAKDDDGQWRAYYRVADENIAASPLQMAVWENENTALTITGSEQALIDFVSRNGNATLRQYMTMAHLTRAAAEASVVAMCRMGALRLDYVDGQCVITAPASGGHPQKA